MNLFMFIEKKNIIIKYLSQIVLLFSKNICLNEWVILDIVLLIFSWPSNGNSIEFDAGLYDSSFIRIHCKLKNWNSEFHSKQCFFDKVRNQNSSKKMEFIIRIGESILESQKPGSMYHNCTLTSPWQHNLQSWDSLNIIFK